MAAIRGALVIILVAVVGYTTWVRVADDMSHPNREATLSAELVTGFASTNQGRTITHRGKAGKTALEVLELAAEVEAVRNSPLQVVAINGRRADEDQRWVLRINGVPQDVPPDELPTADGQTLTWTLE